MVEALNQATSRVKPILKSHPLEPKTTRCLRYFTDIRINIH